MAEKLNTTEKEFGQATAMATPGVHTINGASNASTQDYDREYHNPMAHIHSGNDSRLPAFGGEFQPGLYKPVTARKFANPAPLGLSAFALTTFVLSCVNLGARGVNAPNIVVPLALGYGGLVQLLAGMWEMAVGNTFGATALSSYGGFWISYGILLTPNWNILGEGGPYKTPAALAVDPKMGESAVGFFLTGWLIFTTILLLCTLRSTVMFFMLFFTLDLAFLMLACGAYANDNGAMAASVRLVQAGGAFGMLAAFLAWYNAFAGIADSSNSLFLIPVFHFPWSEKGRQVRSNSKTGREQA
ncbi:GPR1/FUN34/yaaH family-domain-containing protein [Lasiosphaeria hispida]|uniref:GPR1/FUN34/yaaH family-domain-containing protein n=1 Tax=Lasiosphaeria hispida TaxID=260671 RepID=A0AAJ0HBJ0_9PEZI|nr:GPR1/FUN34/yaaH family-domain-containing protein [Lasiosphaeria hispida]